MEKMPTFWNDIICSTCHGSLALVIILFLLFSVDNKHNFAICLKASDSALVFSSNFFSLSLVFYCPSQIYSKVVTWCGSTWQMESVQEPAFGKSNAAQTIPTSVGLELELIFFGAFI